MFLQWRYYMTPHLSQVYFTVFWEQSSEWTLLQEWFPFLSILFFQKRFNRPMIDIIRIPSYSSRFSANQNRVRSSGRGVRLGFLCVCFFFLLASASCSAYASGSSSASLARAASAAAFWALFLRAIVGAWNVRERGGGKSFPHSGGSTFASLFCDHSTVWWERCQIPPFERLNSKFWKNKIASFRKECDARSIQLQFYLIYDESESKQQHQEVTTTGEATEWRMRVLKELKTTSMQKKL